jgi:hypothetical protein
LSGRTGARSSDLYRTDVGLEFRAGYGPTDLIRSQFVIEIGAARGMAAEWKQAVIDKGFNEVRAETRP